MRRNPIPKCMLYNYLIISYFVRIISVAAGESHIEKRCFNNYNMTMLVKIYDV